MGKKLFLIHVHITNIHILSWTKYDHWKIRYKKSLLISLTLPHFSQFQRNNSYKISVMTLKNVQIWKKITNCKRGARAEKSWNPFKFILSKYLDDIFWIANVFIMVTLFLTDLKIWRNMCKSPVSTEYFLFFCDSLERYSCCSSLFFLMRFS